MKRYFTLKAILLSLIGSLMMPLLKAQDAKLNFNLDKNDEVGIFKFSSKNGLWVWRDQKSPVLNGDYQLVKYSADLQNLEWKTELKGVTNYAVIDADNTDYFYMRGYVSGALVGLTNGKKNLTQVNSAGKIKTAEYVKEDDTFDDPLYYFCKNNHFYELWSKKKTDDDLILVKYDAVTLKTTKKTIQIPKPHDEFDPFFWQLNSVHDSIMFLTRHNAKKQQQEEIQAVVINLNTGKVLNKFFFKPKHTTMKSMAIANYSFTQSGSYSCDIPNKYIKKIQGSGNTAIRATMYGQLFLSRDGQSIYHYGFANKSGKEYPNFGIKSVLAKIEGFHLAKMDLNGKVMWEKETLFGDDFMEDLKKFMGPPSEELVKEEKADGSIRFEYTYVIAAMLGKGSAKGFGILYDKDGKEVDRCAKGFKLSGGIVKSAKATVGSIEELYPCFSKNTEKMTKFIGSSKSDDQYRVLYDEDSYLLKVFPANERSVGMYLFK